MNFEDAYFSRQHRYALGIETSNKTHYLSIPVSNGRVDYEEYYALTEEQFRTLLDAQAEAVAFAESCRRHEQDELLIEKPGTNRGTPV